jgi:hypothetical protein
MITKTRRHGRTWIKPDFDIVELIRVYDQFEMKGKKKVYH